MGVRSHCKSNVPHVARNVWLSDFQMFVLICKSNVPHVARNVWLSGFQMFVLIANAMYRTLLATCGSAVFRCLYSLK